LLVYFLAAIRRRTRLENEDVAKSFRASVREEHARLRRFVNVASEVGDVRPLSCSALSPLDSSLLLTGSWTGTAKVCFAS
jgi:hypothetical protein